MSKRHKLYFCHTVLFLLPLYLLLLFMWLFFNDIWCIFNYFYFYIKNILDFLYQFSLKLTISVYKTKGNDNESLSFFCCNILIF